MHKAQSALSTNNPLPDGNQRVHDPPMLPLLVRHEIQVLRRAGHTQADVAQRCGVSVREVRRIQAEPLVQDVDDTALRRRRRLGRPSVAEPWRGFIREQLKHDPELLTRSPVASTKLRRRLDKSSLDIWRPRERAALT